MAAYASDMVGVGIATGKAIDVFVDAGAMSVVYPRLPQSGARLNATDLDLMLIKGNKAVYRDIYWQHLAYREAGIDELLGLIDTSDVSRKDLLRDGWTLIARGDKSNNQGLIWQGNELLLQYEQLVTLQPVYKAFPNLSSVLSVVMISPLPFQWGFLQANQFGKNIGDYPVRWKWIQEVLLPQWKRLEGGSSVSEMRLIFKGAFPKSVACFL
ncbi:MAG: hypothetical protein JWN04_4959 [Myxococcaceae bacterium]|nr:hypothetical protein [Myxococcaceae bacterium]